MQSTTSGATFIGLYTTINYMRGAAGITFFSLFA
jgi:hypothetical protein